MSNGDFQFVLATCAQSAGRQKPDHRLLPPFGASARPQLQAAHLFLQIFLNAFNFELGNFDKLRHPSGLKITMSSKRLMNSGRK